MAEDWLETADAMTIAAVIGAWRHIDGVAYVRFASVYRDFQDVREFQKEIQSLTGEQNPGRN